MPHDTAVGGDGVFRASGHSDGLLSRMDRFRSQRALCDVTLIAGEVRREMQALVDTLKRKLIYDVPHLRAETYVAICWLISHSCIVDYRRVVHYLLSK